MDNFNSGFNPDQFDSRLDDAKAKLKRKSEERRKEEEAEFKAKEKAKSEKKKESKQPKESFFSFKKKSDKALGKAQKQAPESKKKDPRYLAEQLAEDEDNFSAEERKEIEDNQDKIVKRAKQISERVILRQEADDAKPKVNEEPKESEEKKSNQPITEAEALSLAVAEILSGEDQELDYDPAILRSPESIGIDDDEEIELEYPDELVREPSDWDEASILSGTDGIESLSLDEESESSSSPGFKSETLSEEDPTDKSSVRGILNLLNLRSKTKRSADKSIGGDPPTGGYNSVQTSQEKVQTSSGLNTKLKEEKDRGFSIAEALSLGLASRISKVGKSESRHQSNSNVQARGTEQAEQQGAKLNGRNIEDRDIGEQVRRVAPKSDTLRLDVNEELEFYSRIPSGEILDRPVAISRGEFIVGESTSGSTDVKLKDEHSHDKVGPSLVRPETVERGTPLDQSSLKETVFNPVASVTEAANTYNHQIKRADSQTEESKFSIKQFERYLDGIVLKKKPKNAKQLARYVKKDLGRFLSLRELKNVENFWKKKQADVLSRDPDFLTGVDQRRVEAEDSILGSVKHTQLPHSIQSRASQSDSSQSPAVQDSKFRQGSDHSKAPKSIIPAGYTWNLALLVLVVAVLAYVIAYAIILVS